MRYIFALLLLMLLPVVAGEPVGEDDTPPPHPVVPGDDICSVAEEDYPLFCSSAPSSLLGEVPCDFYDSETSTAQALSGFDIFPRFVFCFGALGFPGLGRWVDVFSPAFDPGVYRQGVVVVNGEFAPVSFEDVGVAFPCLVCNDLDAAPGAVSPVGEVSRILRLH